MELIISLSGVVTFWAVMSRFGGSSKKQPVYPVAEKRSYLDR